MIIPLGTPDASVDINDAANSGAAVRVLAHDGGEAEPVVRLTKTRVMRTANKLVDRRAVAVGTVEIAVTIPAQTKWIHLTVRPWFDA